MDSTKRGHITSGELTDVTIYWLNDLEQVTYTESCTARVVIEAASKRKQ